MDARQIQQLKPLLDKYLRQFDDSFGRVEPTERFRTYVTGQLSDLSRKSIEPMADAAGVPPRTLQHFLSRHEWNEDRMRDTLVRIVARDHAHSLSVGVIDETGHPKKGDKTPGVRRQWCGNTGKIDNCVVTVHLNYTAGDFHCLLENDLFLPEDWSDDRPRCRAAGIPDEVVYRSKWQIALRQWRHAVAQGVRFAWLTFDEGYGKAPEFLFTLDDAGQRYVGEVPSIFTGWIVKPALLHKEIHRGRGRPRKTPRLKVKSLPSSSVGDLLRYSPNLRRIPWKKFHIKNTTKGPLVWEAKAIPFYLKREGLPTWAHRLIIARNVLKRDEIKYFVSNSPQEESLEMLLHVAFSRWRVERCFEDEKSELGLSHFEVRNYRSLRRHMIVTAVSYLFLAQVHQNWRGEKSRIDGLPTAHGGVSPSAVAVDERSGSSAMPGTDGLDHHGTATSQRQISPLPCQDEAKAVA
jgi:SRSO17 transposase